MAIYINNNKYNAFINGKKINFNMYNNEEGDTGNDNVVDSIVDISRNSGIATLNFIGNAGYTGDTISDDNITMTVTNLDYTPGNAHGYSGWTKRGLQISNPNNSVIMPFVRCSSVEIEINSLNWVIRNVGIVLRLIAEDDTEYILKAFHWTSLNCYIYSAEDENVSVSSGTISATGKLFDDVSDQFHLINLSFLDDGSIEGCVDGIKGSKLKLGKKIVGVKIYSSETHKTNSPYRKIHFYKNSMSDQDKLESYNNFLLDINYNPFADKQYDTRTEFNTLQDLLNANVEKGTRVHTLGYNTIGDNGGAYYTIMNYDEFFDSLPESAKYIALENEPMKAIVDGFGNHDMKNRLIAVIDLTQELTPEMFGAKGDGITNDTEPFIILFGMLKEGSVKFRKNALYIWGSRKSNEKSYAFDNRYVKPTMNTFNGGCHRPLIVENTGNIIVDGNGATLKIPDDDFGYGMGMMCLGGYINGLEWKNTIFDANGLSMVSDSNKTSAHTICYAPGGTRIESKDATFSNVNFHHNIFKSNGTIRDVSDAGGDMFLIINPLISEHVYIEDNEMYDWGRWVYSVDLGGSGERLYDYKFNRNICIQTDKNLTVTGASRGLGWIDFEARKCWTGLEVCGNTVEGLECFAMNGNGKLLENFTFSDNKITRVTRPYRSAYNYFINFYSVFGAKNVVINNNIFNTSNSINPSSKFIDGIVFKNNHCNPGILTLNDMYNDIIIDNNTTTSTRGAVVSIYDLIYSPPTYLDPENLVCNFVFTNNNGGIVGRPGVGACLYNQHHINFTIENNTDSNFELTTFGHKQFDFDPTQFKAGTQGFVRGAYFTKPTSWNSTNMPVMHCAYYKAGDLVSENVSLGRSELCFIYRDYLKSGKIYNIYCTEDGYFPVAYSDIWMESVLTKNIDKDRFYYTADNLYVCTKAGTLGDTICTHTEGSVTNGTATLLWICNVARFRVEEVI